MPIQRVPWETTYSTWPAYLFNDHEKYLGLPIMVGKNKYKAFEAIKDKVWAKISNWKNMYLSQASKEVLLKLVVQALRAYAMSLFLLPWKICKNMVSSMTNLWWSYMNKSRGIHWRAWKRLGETKSYGGLGFRDLEGFNKALLAKQVWHLLKNPDSLAGRTLKVKYFPSTNFLEANLGRKPSLLWRSLKSSFDVIKEGMFQRIGNGRDTYICKKKKWLPVPITSQSSPFQRTYYRMLRYKT